MSFDASETTGAAKGKLVVMVSSTARDLPEHREQIKEACLRQSMFPLMMEHLPASDADAIATSLRMVNEADIYLGVFAYRYGYVPQSSSLSITEMEYNRAVERGIPRLIFLMDASHPIIFTDVEQGEGAVKLQALKVRLQKERVVNYFTSPTDLQAKVINSLSQYRQPNLTAFHYVSDIPTPPQEYVAHPYSLLQTPSLIGRQQELNLLTSWVTQRDASIYSARILSIVAVGGMGKSALTWKWFQDIAPQEMRRLAGRMWWSFYESDASFEHFVTRALAYVSKRPKEEIRLLSPLEREAQLLAILDQQEYLIVLDGLERILLAYARMDASRLADDDLDQKTANLVAGALGLPASAAQSFIGQNLLRKTTDPHVGNFLKKLAGVRASRILISTRLYPADLQTEMGSERVGCKAVFLQGLTDDDALNLWRAFGISGSRDTLLPLFHTFGNHPLLVQVLAGAITRDRRTPGDFDGWYKNHPDFIPFQHSLLQAQSSILVTALQGLDTAAQNVLFTIAAFRMPTTYDTLCALFLGEGKQFSREDELVQVLTELEDRGLLGWDRRANRYDQHPIVRGVTWNMLNKDTKQDIHEALTAHFSSLPETDEDAISSLDDIAGAIQLYHSLIMLERFEDAMDLFINRLMESLLALGAILQGREMLEGLIPLLLQDEQFGKVIAEYGESLDDLKKFLLGVLALFEEDKPKKSAEAYRDAYNITYMISKADAHESGIYKEDDIENLIFFAFLRVESLLLSTSICEAEAIISNLPNELSLSEDSVATVTFLNSIGFTYAIRGKHKESEIAFRHAFSCLDREDTLGMEYYALQSLWLGHYQRAYGIAQEAKNDYDHQAFRFKSRIIRSTRLQGQAALALGRVAEAEDILQEVLAQARALNQVAEEIPTRIALAELRRQQGDYKGAHELLDDMWEAAERGPFRLYLADACNVLAQIERDEGNVKNAVQAATSAYQYAWYDGPPFAYHWGLQQAKAHLSALGAREPELPPFDPAAHEPIPELKLEL